MDFAASKVCLKASGVEMSGFGAPSRTPTPIPVRAMSVRVPGATAPCRAISSMAISVMITTSAASPAVSFWRMTPTVPNVNVAVCPVSCRNAAARSVTIARTAPALSTLISAAGSGIGRATAEIIGAEGGAVVGVDTDKARLDALVDTIRRGGGQAEARRADGLDPAQVTEAVDGVARTHGRIDILVNAVGGSTIIARPAATVDELTLAEWQRLIAFNLDATFLFCHAVAPVMKRQRSGKIVNISSIAGRGISPTSSSAYAAAKGGIIAFTRKLAHELGPFGVTVNAIAPSLTLTERIRPRWAQRTRSEEHTSELQSRGHLVCRLLLGKKKKPSGLSS